MKKSGRSWDPPHKRVSKNTMWQVLGPQAISRRPCIYNFCKLPHKYYIPTHFAYTKKRMWRLPGSCHYLNNGREFFCEKKTGKRKTSRSLQIRGVAGTGASAWSQDLPDFFIYDMFSHVATIVYVYHILTTTTYLVYIIYQSEKSPNG